MNNVVLQWLERMRYDLDTARAMLKMRKYLYVSFMCQQAVEKGLKAVLAKLNERIPLIHNLRKLAMIAGLEADMTEDQIDLLEQLTPFAIKARYGSYKKKLSELCDRKKAMEFVSRTERLIKWLEERI
jgi:HEPN domain-containing protein